MESIFQNKFKNVIQEHGKKLRSKWRKIVTGREDTRIRDHLIEFQEEPRYIKAFDKVAFTLGVLNIVACQYFLLNQASYFWLWYSIVIPLLMVARFYTFKKKAMQYFLLDFCYYSLFCNFCLLFIFSNSPLLFKICYVYANGPVAFAIVVWRCSLVFHDNEKMTSVYIHILPSMLFYTIRWSSKWPSSTESFRSTDMFAAMFGYLLWQTLYFMKTEYFDKDKLDRNPNMVTSLRHLSADYKNSTAITTLKLCRRLGIMTRTENFDAKSAKTKIIFMSTQLVYTFVTMLAAPLFYASQIFSLVHLTFIFSVAVYNGGNYYIEVFSARYQEQLTTKQNMKRVAQVAAEVAYEAASVKRNRSSSRLSSSSASLSRHASMENKPPHSPSPYSSVSAISTAQASPVGTRRKSSAVPPLVSDLDVAFVPEYVVLDGEECKDPHAQQVPDTSAEKEETTSDGSDEEDRHHMEVIQAATSAFVEALILEDEARQYEEEHGDSDDQTSRNTDSDGDLSASDCHTEGDDHLKAD